VLLAFMLARAPRALSFELADVPTPLQLDTTVSAADDPPYSADEAASDGILRPRGDASDPDRAADHSPPSIPVSSPSAPAAPDYPGVRLTGFFQADAVWFDQDVANRLVIGDLQDGADFRRTRLAAVGDVWDNVSYSLEMDFAFPGRPSFMDVWLDVRDVLGSNTLRFGQFRQPIGMEAMTSVRELTFLERALPFAFLPFRQIGLMGYGHSYSEDSTWAVSVFRHPTDPFGGNVGDAGGYSLAGRLTGLLVANDQGVLHMGGGYSLIDPANDRAQYRNQPEVFVGETGGAALVPDFVPANVPPFVDTGLIDTHLVNLFNVELAGSYESLYWQSEATYASIDQFSGPTVNLSGAYAHAGLFLTGEQRTYNRATGTFGRVVPLCPVGGQGGPGAWELAGRWSYIDLDDENILGGRLHDVTLGVNWYLNRYTKFQFNYIHAFLTRPAAVESDADIFAVRGQLDF
jgi:phosphate-selective porin OprO/OprP